MNSNAHFILAVWLLIVAVVGLSRVYDSAPPQAVGATIVSGTVLFLLLSRFYAAFGAWLDGVSIETMICWHAIRAPIGAAFLVMASQEMLPALFATRAGYGDLFAAALGIAALTFVRFANSRRAKKLTFAVWNLFGLADLMLAVGTGIYLGFTVTDSMTQIARLPLLIVPTFVLPLLFGTHFIMLKRIWIGSGFEQSAET